MPRERERIPDISNEQLDKKSTVRRMAFYALCAAVAVGVVGLRQVEAGSLEYSDETEIVVIPSGQGVGYAAAQVDGIGKVRTEVVIEDIENMPENQKALSDGIQAYEGIVIHKSVRP